MNMNNFLSIIYLCIQSTIEFENHLSLVAQLLYFYAIDCCSNNKNISVFQHKRVDLANIFKFEVQNALNFNESHKIVRTNV